MRILFLVVLILAGCANPNFTEGMANVKNGNYAIAFDRFKICFVETIDPACANNAGVAAEGMGNMADAQAWYTLAARYGHSRAVTNLIKMGWPVPAADLAQRQAAQPSILNSIGQGLSIAGGALGAAPAAPAKQLDAGCWMQCIDNYSPPFCKNKCSY